ncbi:aspartyl protease family protein [Nonomuraea sp. NPDC050556]|uniref:aspartyl protease family protein n=1 Tax=Nonomuraea sp. NPDC050556 TaxID=3364369 RepID=UPI00379A8682
MATDPLSVPLIVEPDPDYPDCATILVDGVIAGLPHRFVLDTGTARTHVTADDYTSTLPSHAQHQATGVFASCGQDLVMLPSVSLGPVTIPDLEVTRAPSSRSLLGMDVLGSVALRFDFLRAELSMAASGSFPTRWPLERSPGGHPFIDVVWPGTTGRACWDSGAGITVVDRGFLTEHSDLFQPIGTATGTDSTGTQVETELYVMAEARAGDAILAPTTVAAADLPRTNGRMDLTLGYPALCQADWVLDFPANRWSATPSQTADMALRDRAG